MIFEDEAIQKSMLKFNQAIKEFSVGIVTLVDAVAELIRAIDFDKLYDSIMCQLEKQYRLKPRPPKVIKPTVRAPYIPVMPRARSNLRCPRKHRLCVHNG